MYLPKSQYVKNTTTSSLLKDTAGNNVPPGTTITTSFGTSLSVPSLADLAAGNFKNSKVLTPNHPNLSELLDWDILKHKKDTVYYPTPTEEDYLNGYLDRYFIRDRRTQRIIEVDKKGYTKAKARKSFKRITLKWVLKGPAEDQIIGKYLYPGAESQNKNIVDQAEEHLKGLREYIKDYKQFVK